MDTEPDTNIYGPTREIVQGYTYPEIIALFSAHERKQFLSLVKTSYNPQTSTIGYYDDYVGMFKYTNWMKEVRR